MIAYSIAAVFVLCLGILVERGVRLWTLLREMDAAASNYDTREM